MPPTCFPSGANQSQIGKANSPAICCISQAWESANCLESVLPPPASSISPDALPGPEAGGQWPLCQDGEWAWVRLQNHSLNTSSVFIQQKMKWKVCNYVAYLNQGVIQTGNLTLSHESNGGKSWRCSLHNIEENIHPGTYAQLCLEVVLENLHLGNRFIEILLAKLCFKKSSSVDNFEK